jgi:hypothetical protein
VVSYTNNTSLNVQDDDDRHRRAHHDIADDVAWYKLTYDLDMGRFLCMLLTVFSGQRWNLDSDRFDFMLTAVSDFPAAGR